uniref:Uncharacterized protein n=1 Tax=Tanacetum cinerariifolium TaxID=118510 RepID=A0A699HC33_TANCI|nr:hypothetical protein [Tanacetum cinerariifolium]
MNTELNMEFLTLETSVGKKANEPIGVTQVSVTESVGGLNDATVYADVSTRAPNTTGQTVNVANLKTTPTNQNGGDQVGNESANVAIGTNYDVWLPLDLVHEVNDRMKNSLYTYFIGKWLAYSVVEWFVRNNWEKCGSEKVMAISVSSDSSEDSVGTPAGRVILFGTIPTTIPDTTPVITPPTTQIDATVIPIETPIITPTIPPSPDYTPASPNYSPASETESDTSEDPSSGHIPPLPAVLLFLSSDDDTTDSDTLDTPPSPTHGTPFTEITASTQRSLAIPRPSRKRRRSPMTSVPALPLVSRASSPVRTDLIPSPKRVRDIGYLADVEVGPRETRVERVTHPAMPEDIPDPTHEGAGHRIVRVESAVTALTERVAELERDNRRLRGTANVESQRVD